jgi:hypothetical protein
MFGHPSNTVFIPERISQQNSCHILDSFWFIAGVRGSTLIEHDTAQSAGFWFLESAFGNLKIPHYIQSELELERWNFSLRYRSATLAIGN